MKISAKNYFGHGRLRVLAAVALALAACETQSPVGPTGVTLTTTVPTTSVPGTIGTTSTSTTSITLATVRSYISFGQVAANVPSALTIVLQPLSGRPTAASLLDKLPLFEKQVDPIFWTVSGFYVTPGGGSGQVLGQFQGTLDDGLFTGSLTNETPECTAQREFGGTVDPQFLRWSGGRTLNDCKGSPLSFNSLTMGATNAPPPTTTIGATSTTTTPVTCSFSTSTTGVSVESSGGQRSVGITTGPTCNWTVQNFVDWISAQPTAGTGPGNVNLTIAPNPGAPRSATVVIAGVPVVVNQGQVVTTTTTSIATTSIPTSIPTTSSTTSSTTSTTSTTTTSILARADLQPTAPITTPSASFCATTNGGNDLQVIILNGGNADAITSVTRVFFDAGSAGISSSDQVTPVITPKGTANLAFPIPGNCFNIPACRIRIEADALNNVTESNEANNAAVDSCVFSTIGIRAPGLANVK